MSCPPRPRRLLLACLLLLLGWAGPRASARDRGDLRYPENLAWRLVTEEEVEQTTGSPQPLGREERTAPPLFTLEVPLADLPALPDRQRVMVRPGTSWEVAPFPSLPPPTPSELPPEAVSSWEELMSLPGGRPPAFAGLTSGTHAAPAFREVSSRPGPAPPSFAEVPTARREAPSARLRPRPSYSSEVLLKPAAELPRPFSLRRYHTRDLGFFQIALYEGTTGFAAERTFRTLRAASPNREPLEGIGEEAFLTLLPPAPPPQPPQAPDRPEPPPSPQEPAPESPPLERIPVVGPPRPDLLDPGLNVARGAPTFASIPVDLTPLPDRAPPEPAPPPAAEPPPPPANEPPPPHGQDPFAARPSLGDPGILVLVALLPEEGLVLELAMDRRLGDSQRLIELAMLVQGRLLRSW